jgi:ATP-dependent RNA helicase DHX29
MVWVDSPKAHWNVHSKSPAAIKASLTAAMYPQIACMDSESSSMSPPIWFDKTSAVRVHPSSILHKVPTSRFTSPHLLYSEKKKTTAVFVRDLSVVPPLALLLFGGELEVHHDAGYVLLDGWIKVCCSIVDWNIL